MRRAGIIAAGILIGVMVCLLGAKAAFLIVAWRHEAAAERLLGVVRELQPGVTTVDQLETVFAKNREFHFQCNDVVDGPQVSTRVENWPDHYPGFPFYHGSLERRKMFARLMPRWTVLHVELMCAQGKLMSVIVSEWQQHDDPLPKGDKAVRNSYEVTTEYVGDFPSDWWVVRTAPGRHYWVFERREYDDGGSRPIGYQITLDRHATAEERRQVLDFDLGCFVRLSGCQHPNLSRKPLTPNVRMAADGTTELVDTGKP